MAGERSDPPAGEPESAAEGERNSSIFSPVRSGSFCFPCIGLIRPPSAGLSWWERFRMARSQSGDGQRWLRGVRVLKKIQELTEIVAGPKWKTFIRQFNRNCRGGCGGARHLEFQYDPLSYALNFEGQNSVCEDEDDDFSWYRNFSARYAAVPLPFSTSAHRGSGKELQQSYRICKFCEGDSAQGRLKSTDGAR